MKQYNPKDIEPRWQNYWTESNTYTADLHSDKPKYIAMSMFNYPSGAGIHIGHAMNYTISDVKARFKRQQGYESYHPVGWDAFGLPAENYAIKAGVSPQESMATIIPSYHKQYRAMGWSNDWEKEIATHLPEYYKWTQWIFAQMHKNGLAYQDSRMQWWCTKCQTVLANEQVIDGKCWRHDSAADPLVEKKEVKQWFFKITDYADELLESTEALDWTESVKLAQKNWIGRSIGAEVDFVVRDHDDKITVFTTRPDTLFGTTFLVLAPEHDLVAKITTDGQKAEVEDYIKATQKKTDIERQSDKEKTGVFTGAYAINPVNNKEIPIWVTDYVLVGYGTGAVMGSAAHDQRDYEFARKYDLPIIQVVAPETGVKRDDETFADGGCSVVFDPAQQKYAFGQLDSGRIVLFAGGLNDGEELHDAIIRELAEESGLTDIKQYEEIGVAYGHYRNALKRVNRRAKATCLLVELSSAKTVEQKLESHENHKLVWMSAGEVLDNWQAHNQDGGYDHYIMFLRQAVGRAIERGIDTTSDPKVFFSQALPSEGIMINSGPYDGKTAAEMRDKIVADLAAKGQAKERVNYRMRDWSVSRQRYWGAPIPVVSCQQCGNVLVPDDQLPVVLPELDDFAPSGDGRSALARAKDWLTTECPQCGGPGERETDTLDTYICSSWYMYRYFDSHNQQAIFDSEIVKKWEPIDFYNGADHATAHLLYARFIGHFFKKIGLVDEPEPFKQFLFNGKVTASDGTMFSKSKGNGVDPLDIIDQGYGADALRTYLMFAAPLEIWAKWDPQGVPGTYRFLSRLWHLVQEYQEAKEGELDENVQKEILRAIHPMIHKVTNDLERNSYNTAIAKIMETLNTLYRIKAKNLVKHDVWQQALEAMVATVAPFAPHIAEELWHQLGHSTTVHIDTWPKHDDAYLTSDHMTIVIQVNGKVRSQIEVPVGSDKDSVLAAAKADPKAAPHTEGKEIKKEIYVPGKLVNLVV